MFTHKRFWLHTSSDIDGSFNFDLCSIEKCFDVSLSHADTIAILLMGNFLNILYMNIFQRWTSFYWIVKETLHYPSLIPKHRRRRGFKPGSAGDPANREQFVVEQYAGILCRDMLRTYTATTSTTKNGSNMCTMRPAYNNICLYIFCIDTYVVQSTLSGVFNSPNLETLLVSTPRHTHTRHYITYAHSHTHTDEAGALCACLYSWCVRDARFARFCTENAKHFTRNRLADRCDTRKTTGEKQTSRQHPGHPSEPQRSEYLCFSECICFGSVTTYM